MNRLSVHLVAVFRYWELFGFRRDELQDLLDVKTKKEDLSFSVVDHLRWDMKSKTVHRALDLRERVIAKRAMKRECFLRKA